MKSKKSEQRTEICSDCKSFEYGKHSFKQGKCGHFLSTNFNKPVDGNKRQCRYGESI